MPTLEPLSVEVLLAQGRCCGKGCQNCPYRDVLGRRHIKGTRQVDPQVLINQGKKTGTNGGEVV